MRHSRSPSTTRSLLTQSMIDSVSVERSRLAKIESMTIEELKKHVGEKEFSKIYREEFKKMNQCEDKCINKRDEEIRGRLVALVLNQKKPILTRNKNKRSVRQSRITRGSVKSPSPDPVSPVKEPVFRESELRDPPPLPVRAAGKRKRKYTRKRTKKRKHSKKSKHSKKRKHTKKRKHSKN
jgi:hypothetical protein